MTNSICKFSKKKEHEYIRVRLCKHCGEWEKVPVKKPEVKRRKVIMV